MCVDVLCNFTICILVNKLCLVSFIISNNKSNIIKKKELLLHSLNVARAHTHTLFKLANFFFPLFLHLEFDKIKNLKKKNKSTKAKRDSHVKDSVVRLEKK